MKIRSQLRFLRTNHHGFSRSRYRYRRGGAILPDAPSAAAFWDNIVGKRYSISETPLERWSIADYYDSDPKAPDKTYSKIGGWVRGYEFDWRSGSACRPELPRQWMRDSNGPSQSPPTRWPTTATPTGSDTDRTGVILGTAMGGELHYVTAQRIHFPEYIRMLRNTGRHALLHRPTGDHRAIS